MLNIRTYCLCVRFLSFVAVSFLVPSVAEASDRPNIVFFLVDDLHALGLGATGHPFAITPNIDRLAHEGIRFTNAHVTTPLCSPSRASFLSGQYARSHGVLGNRSMEPDPDRVPSFPQLLQAQGYRTGFVGKWHQENHDDPRPGFDMWAAFAGQGAYVGSSDTPIVIRYAEGQVNRVDRYEEGQYNTDLLTEYASNWLSRVAEPDDERPFCLLLWYKAVHGPRVPAPRHAELYLDQHFLPMSEATLNPRPEGKPEQVQSFIENWNQSSLERKLDVVDSLARKDQRTLASVDESVGIILQQLEDQGKLDNTVVVFSSDNGYFFREFGLDDKRWLYEPATRVPLLIRYPELIAPGRTSDLGVLNVDLAPTLLDLAGSQWPTAMQGRSMRAILDATVTDSSQWRTSWLTEYFLDPPFTIPVAEAVSVSSPYGSLKYTNFPWNAPENELYNLSSDPGELWNLFDPGPVRRFPASDLEQERSRLVSVAAGRRPIHPFLDCFHRTTVHGEAQDQGVGLRLVQPGDGRLEPVTVNGRNARRTLPGSSYMYFNVIDDWTRDGLRPVVDVTVTYLDSGSGSLYIHYDAVGAAGSTEGGPYQRSELVQLGNTGRWLEHRFRLDQVLFAGRQNAAADFRVGRTSGDPVVVDRITLDAPPPTCGRIDLGELDDSRFLFRVENPGGETVSSTIAGKSCRANLDPAVDHSHSFAVADELAFDGSSPELLMTVEFYDQGRGLISLEYDGEHGPYTFGGSVRLTSTSRWRLHQFRITKALLANRQTNGADFRLVAGQGPLYLDRVSVGQIDGARRSGDRVRP